MTNASKESRITEYRDSIVIAVLGLLFGLFFNYYCGIRDLQALTFIIAAPIAFMAITKGLKYGALLAIIGAAVYGSVIIFRIIQGTAQLGVTRQSVVNIAIIIAVGFIFGVISETMKFKDSSIFREVTTVETFVPDEDTGLYNFKSFRWMLSGEIKRVKRYNTPLSLIFIRVDNLVDFQQHYDYNQEIALYRELGRFLRNILRDADYIGKYSDNEIGAILPETNANGVNIVLQRILQNKTRAFEILSGMWKDVVPDISISSANFPKDASNLEELVDVLDSRYQSF
jgi:diguanylate cyclase (GGDEF)-like protein